VNFLKRKEESSFLKKRSKRLLYVWAWIRCRQKPQAQRTKSLFASFSSEKEASYFSCSHPIALCRGGQAVKIVPAQRTAHLDMRMIEIRGFIANHPQSVHHRARSCVGGNHHRHQFTQPMPDKSIGRRGPGRFPNIHAPAASRFPPPARKAPRNPRSLCRKIR